MKGIRFTVWSQLHALKREKCLIPTCSKWYHKGQRKTIQTEQTSMEQSRLERKKNEIYTKKSEFLKSPEQRDLYAMNFMRLRELKSIMLDYQEELEYIFRDSYYQCVLSVPTITMEKESLNDRFGKERNEIVVVGRSNVGKSSLLNEIMFSKHMVRKGSRPGTTRMLNYFHMGTRDKGIMMIDTPGYGYAKLKMDEKKMFVPMIKEYLQSRLTDPYNLRMVYLLVDMRRFELKDLDLKMVRFLHRHQIPYTIILTKSDKCKKSRLDFHIGSLLETCKLEGAGALPLVIPTSSKSTHNIDLVRMSIYQSAIIQREIKPNYAHTDLLFQAISQPHTDPNRIVVPRGPKALKKETSNPQKMFVSKPKAIHSHWKRSEKDEKKFNHILRVTRAKKKVKKQKLPRKLQILK